MNKISMERKIQIVNALCQGMSLRAITRLLDVHRTTVMNVLVEAGTRCERILAENVYGVDAQSLQMDEIWTFCKKKQGRLKPEERANLGIGDQYLFYALDPDTKLVVAWELGKRDRLTTLRFVGKVKRSLNGTRPQINTDSFPPYAMAMQRIFGPTVDHMSIVKLFNGVPAGRGRYAPPKVSCVQKTIECGNPDFRSASTSHIERANLTLRTMQKRFARLTLGFSKKAENLRAAVALHFAYYNFIWIPRTTGMTPAMAAGLTDRPWNISDLVGGV